MLKLEKHNILLNESSGEYTTVEIEVEKFLLKDNATEYINKILFAMLSLLPDNTKCKVYISANYISDNISRIKDEPKLITKEVEKEDQTHILEESDLAFLTDYDNIKGLTLSITIATTKTHVPGFSLQLLGYFSFDRVDLI